VTTVLLDTHVVHWWSAEPGRLSKVASDAIESADVLAVAAISWFELAWLAANGRVVITVPLRSWLDRLAEHVVTLPIDPAIAAAAVALPNTFPGDPADRLIYATAIVRGLRLVTKDGRLREHPSPGPVTVW
jgi:PIN domain nuclease of toxin-antitoxin system